MWYFTSTNRRTKKDASAVPHSFLVPLNFINFIADFIVILRPRIGFTAATNETSFVRNSYKKIVSQKFRSSIFTKIIMETFGSSKRIRFLVRISTRTRASPSLRYFFTFILLFVFFSFFFLILLYRCRARARKKMKNARFLLHSVCDRFLFRTSNVPLSFSLYNNQNARGTMIVASLYHVHAYTVY